MGRKLECTLVISEADDYTGLANTLRHLANRIENGEMTLKSKKHEEPWYYAEVFEMPVNIGEIESNGVKKQINLAEIVDHGQKDDHGAARHYAISLLEAASASDKRRLVVAINGEGKLAAGFVPLDADDETIAIALGMDSHDSLMSYDVLSAIKVT